MVIRFIQVTVAIVLVLLVVNLIAALLIYSPRGSHVLIVVLDRLSDLRGGHLRPEPENGLEQEVGSRSGVLAGGLGMDLRAAPGSGQIMSGTDTSKRR